MLQVYLRAKQAADDDLRARDLAWTVVKPGRLTNDPGTGRVSVGRALRGGTIPRDDVAATLLAVLLTPSTTGITFDLVGGSTPVDEAVASL